LDRVFDLAIIGGGINGCGIARDAVGRGNSVFLCEMNDLASGTSSWSTKLVHGGLRYLEYYEFRLVREALIEREVLWQIAPHIIRPLRFVLPHHAGLRPAWMLRLGLFLYDHIGGRNLLPPTRSVDLTSDAVGHPPAQLGEVVAVETAVEHAVGVVDLAVPHQVDDGDVPGGAVLVEGAHQAVASAAARAAAGRASAILWTAVSSWAVDTNQDSKDDGGR